MIHWGPAIRTTDTEVDSLIRADRENHVKRVQVMVRVRIPGYRDTGYRVLHKSK